MEKRHQGVLLARAPEELIPKTLSKTYEEVALQFIDAIGNDDVMLREHGVVVKRGKFVDISHLFVDHESGVRQMREVVKEGIIRFAHHLDKFNHMSSQLELIALYKAREIDREFLLMLIEEVGIDKARILAMALTERHRHSLSK